MQSYADIAGIKIGDTYPVRIMGVINVSPESFFKGSVFSSEDALKRVAERLVKEGAAIIDVGARGTAPYLKTDISVEEEGARLTHAIEIIREVTDVPISADTQSAIVAEAALQAGASIINDVSGLAHDAAMADVAKKYQGVILMAHADYTAMEGNPVSVVHTSLTAALKRAEQAGIARDKIVLDPGLGFFRNRDISWDQWDRIILQQLSQFHSFGKPLLIGISRKSFIGKILGHANPDDRLYGSLGLTALSVLQGIHLIRTHDVAATRDVVKITEWFKEE